MGVRAVIDGKGRLLIPSELRRQAGLGEGDTVIVKPVGPGEFRVVGLRNVADTGLGMYRHLRKEGESIVDEFIAERKREAEEESK